MRYLGYIQRFRDFYNFTPLYRVTNTGTLIYLTLEERQMVLPKSANRNINISAPWNTSMDHTYADLIDDNQVIVMDFELKDLEDNINAQGVRNLTGYRISPYKAVTGGHLKNVNAIGCYYVVEQKDLPEGFELENRVLLDIPGFYPETEILVHYRDGFFAGPFKTMHRKIDNADLFQPMVRENGFLMEGYPASAVKGIPISINHAPSDWGSDYADSDSQERRIVQVKAGSSREVRDMIPEEELIAAFLRSLSGRDCQIWSSSSVDAELLLERFRQQEAAKGVSEAILLERVRRLQKILSPCLYQSSRPGEVLGKLLAKKADSSVVQEALKEIKKSDPGFMDRVRSSGSSSVRAAVRGSEGAAADVQTSEECSFEHFAGGISEEIFADALSQEIRAQAEAGNEESSALPKDQPDQRNEALRRAAKAAQERAENLAWENERLEVLYAGYPLPGVSSGRTAGESTPDHSWWEEFFYYDALMEMNGRSHEEMGREAFCEYLIKAFKSVRPRYTDNQILNIAICVAQNFLTIFAGDPGSGKTSACTILAEALGLDQIQTKLHLTPPSTVSRYMPICVERGWNSRKDWIGTFSALTGRFEEGAANLYRGLKILDMENAENLALFPFLVLLDEANLSPIEYYFSDFMKVCDELDGSGTVSLGGENTLKIPETLRFLATVNVDHTMEMLTQRLIDRAMVISMPLVKDSAPAPRLSEEIRKPIGWATLKTLIPEEGRQLMMSQETARILDRILPHMKKIGNRMSPRVFRAIHRYASIASQVMKAEPGGRNVSQIVADYAVAQKILPKISGKGKSYRNWLEELWEICEDDKLLVSTEIVSRILERGEGDSFDFFC